MILKAIHVYNFKSFVGKHSFDFLGGKPGLYFISGENKVDPALGSNGSGKSTLIDAIKWVLYGKTVRNLKAGDVHSRNVKGSTSVEIEINLNGTDYSIYRSWSPNKLCISKMGGEQVAVLQDQVDKLIGLNEDDFLNSVVYGQFNTSFLDLQPSQMLNTFTGILNLDFWTEKSEKAALSRTNSQRDVNSQGAKLAFCNGRIDQLKRSLSSFIESSNKFDADKDKKLSQLEADHASLLEELNSLPPEEHVPKTDTSSLIPGLRAQIEEVRNVLNEIREDENRIFSEIMVKQNDLNRAAAILEEIQRKNGICPACEQPLPEEPSEERIVALELEIEVGQRALEALRTRRSDSMAERAEAEALIRQLESDILRQDGLEREILKKANEVARKKATLEGKLDALEADFKNVDSSSNPYLDRISVTNNEIDLETQKLADIQKSIDVLNTQISIYDKWVKGFKDIRLLVIEQALTDLEIEVNNAIEELGLEGWSIKFDVEKENKSGGVSKGFTVLVHSPTNAAAVPWAAWSGGEGQRLRLAATAGLNSLILSRRNVNPNIEIYDEPSKHLSEEGLADLATFLENRARVLQKQIWLVDHNIPDFSGVSGAIKIIKDSNGSRIEIGR